MKPHTEKIRNYFFDVPSRMDAARKGIEELSEEELESIVGGAQQHTANHDPSKGSFIAWNGERASGNKQYRSTSDGGDIKFRDHQLVDV